MLMNRQSNMRVQYALTCNGIKKHPGSVNRGANAEGKGFEPLVRGYRTLVFKTSSIGRSDNLPR